MHVQHDLFAYINVHMSTVYTSVLLSFVRYSILGVMLQPHADICK